jgi:hypothetical protein
LPRKAHQALSDGGVLIVYDAIIDDDRSSNTFGLLMSLNMLIETPAGFNYTPLLPHLDGRHRLPPQLHRTARPTRLHGRRHQVMRRPSPSKACSPMSLR